MAGVVYKDICLQYGLKGPRSKWKTPPKVVENDKDFPIQSDKRVMANQLDMAVVDKQQLTVWSSYFNIYSISKKR